MKWYNFFYFLCFVLVCVGFTVFISEKNYTSNVVVNEKSVSNILSNAISMLYETEAGSGEYQISTDTTWPQDDYVFNERLSSCENGGKFSWNEETKRIIMQTNKSDKCYVYFDLFNESTLKDVILQDNPNVLTRTDFSVSYSEDNVGQIFVSSGNETEDINNDGVGEDVYYFAGNALNNWVKFGKNENNQDLYWRIIRINEDDSIRLLYSGTSPFTTEGYIGKSVFNDEIKSPKYVGYMYGDGDGLENDRLNTNNSAIKNLIDEWYEKSLYSKSDVQNFLYDSYISKTAIYCNDRSTNEYDFIEIYFASMKRVDDAIPVPSYKCGNTRSLLPYENVSIEDKFTANDTIGNNRLKYSVGLMTADELTYAGMVRDKELNGWYSLNAEGNSITNLKSWWTMSPFMLLCITLGNSQSTMFIYNSSSKLWSEIVNNIAAIRPVISLKPCVYWKSGNGSSSSPYEVFIDNACVNNE